MNKEKQGKKLRFNLKSNPIMGVLIPLIFIMLVTQIFNHNFLTGANLSSILKSIPFLALATLGASFPLLIGEIDISVGRIAGLCGMFFSLLFVVYNLPLPVSILCALALGLVIGFVNAFLVVKIGMSSFIATMGTLYICGGLRYLVNGGTVMTLPTEMRTAYVVRTEMREAFEQQFPEGEAPILEYENEKLAIYVGDRNYVEL